MADESNSQKIAAFCSAIASMTTAYGATLPATVFTVYNTVKLVNRNKDTDLKESCQDIEKSIGEMRDQLYKDDEAMKYEINLAIWNAKNAYHKEEIDRKQYKARLLEIFGILLGIMVRDKDVTGSVFAPAEVQKGGPKESKATQIWSSLTENFNRKVWQIQQISSTLTGPSGMSILASGVPVQEYAKAVRRTHPPQSAYAPYPSPSTMVPYAPSNYQYAATQAPYQQPSASTSGQYITASTTTTTSNVDQPGYMYTPLGYFPTS